MKRHSFVPFIASAALVVPLVAGGCTWQRLTPESTESENVVALPGESDSDTTTLGVLGSKDAVIEALLRINEAARPNGTDEVLDASFNSRPDTGDSDYYVMGLNYFYKTGSSTYGTDVGDGLTLWTVYKNGEGTSMIDGTFTIQDDGTIQIGPGSSVETGQTGLYPSHDGKNITSFTMSYQGLDDEGMPEYDLIATGGELTLTTTYSTIS